MAALSPFVYWAQTEDQVTLKVDLKNVKNPEIDISANHISFKCFGTGARCENKYEFYIDLFEKIDHQENVYKQMDRHIYFHLKKITKEWWPRVTSQPQKPHWLKIDFDRWRSPEDVDDEPENTRDVMTDYPRMYDQLQHEEYGYRKEQTKTVYLIFYNFCQFIDFLYILIVMSIHYYRDGVDSMAGTYENVGNAFKFCQILQYLEVMHPLFGYTKGGMLMPFIQITGRNFVLFAMINAEERMQTKPVVFYLFIVWASVEVIRYPYYITGLIKKNIPLLTWLRYSIWIPLYPLGILCEGIVILRNIPYFEETNRFTVELPNILNFTFHMPTFMKCYLLILILPGTYFMLNYMRKQRSKKLLGGIASANGKSWQKVKSK